MFKQGQLSQHFWRHEFACKCGCGFDTVDAELIEILELIRFECGGKSVIITSGCRCPEHNKTIGGSPNSQHVKGRAADFKVMGVRPDDVANICELWFPNRYGLGRYRGRCHIDSRAGKSRWDLRK